MLRDWWKQFDDPLLAELIVAAEQDSPQLAQATARIAQARAAAQGARSGFFPTLDANARSTRSRSELPPAPGVQTSTSTTIDAQWELDVFGATRNAVRAGDARVQSSTLQWHEARVSLAAEVATQYINLRSCEALVAINQQDSQSQHASAELTQQKVDAGFESPANGALARASAADAANRRVAQQAECDVTIKVLVALVGMPEPVLRGRLSAQSARLPQPADFVVPAVPAQVLSQRPDLAASEREIAATIAETYAAQANRFPRLTLGGSIGTAGITLGGTSSTSHTWSFGPALSLPIFDAGRRKADVDAARARHGETVALYRQRVRTAVREVEESLVRLDAAQRRTNDAEIAARGYADFFAAAKARWNTGTGSLLDLEEARRTSLAADAGLIQVRRERVIAWVNLYKAVGGGWRQE